jgi:phage shock protein E
VPHGIVREASLGHSMKRLAISLIALVALLAMFATLSAAAQGVADTPAPIINPAIDQNAYLRVVGAALGQRAQHRLSEAEFVRMSREPGTVVLDARSNFSGAEGAFPSKLPSASLNLPTYIALYDYGYRNVYELGPLIDIASTSIAFEG